LQDQGLVSQNQGLTLKVKDLTIKAKDLTCKAKANDPKFVLEDTSSPRTKAKDNTAFQSPL